MSHPFNNIGVPPPHRGRGFTLIELLVVVAIIAILISILLPSLSRAKELARRTACSIQQRGIRQAAVLFSHDHDSFLPGVGENPAGGWGITGQYWSGGALYEVEEISALAMPRLWPDNWGLHQTPGGGDLGDKKIMLCPSRASSLIRHSDFVIRTWQKIVEGVDYMVYTFPITYWSHNHVTSSTIW